MSSKNVFIVYAHPELKSLNGAILDATTEVLKSRGHTVTVSDLYRMGFNPLLGRKDLTVDPKNPDVFQWLYEITQASVDGHITDDIRSEQAKLDAADLVIFQFPFYWMGLPAILKGWFDRVMHPGYATELPFKTFDLGRFKGKQAMFSITCGGTKEVYSDRGLMGDINVIL
ncbi:hypothetical protein LSH36_863g00036 [Paralvinella palmiformis]|uniref:Flavodoxin-like fold domain-containing protein n=1 Tax=Paralvinella palmiformis TaxID=53620 RepID=A0AAD9IYB5_9ANNE|nr:hypothetical protein LSH36_863g00036 [Paralvinella palmiformis]